MGNTVSAAEKVAADIIHPLKEPKPADHQYSLKAGAQPPPECPMHQKMPSKSECPVNYDKDGINPLNMVRTHTFLNYFLLRI